MRRGYQSGLYAITYKNAYRSMTVHKTFHGYLMTSLRGQSYRMVFQRLLLGDRKKTVLELWVEFNVAEFGIQSWVYDRPLTARSCICWMIQWTNLSVYFRSVALLHVASRLLRHGFNDELMDILATVFDFHST